MSFWGWVWTLVSKYWRWFLSGTGYTLLLAITGTIVGFLIGLLVGVIRTIPIHETDSWLRKGVLRVVNFLISVYVEVFRGTPMMVQATLFYYGLPMLFNHYNIDFQMNNNLACGASGRFGQHGRVHGGDCARRYLVDRQGAV